MSGSHPTVAHPGGPFASNLVVRLHDQQPVKMAAEYRPYSFTRVYRNRDLRPLSIATASDPNPSRRRSEGMNTEAMVPPTARHCSAFGPGLETVTVGERRAHSPPHRMASRISFLFSRFAFLVRIRSMPSLRVNVHDCGGRQYRPTSPAEPAACAPVGIGGTRVPRPCCHVCGNGGWRVHGRAPFVFNRFPLSLLGCVCHSKVCVIHSPTVCSTRLDCRMFPRQEMFRACPYR